MIKWLIYFGIIIVGFGCQSKLAIPLQKIQDKQYATGWRKIDTYPISYGRSDDLHFFDKN